MFPTKAYIVAIILLLFVEVLAQPHQIYTYIPSRPFILFLWCTLKYMFSFSVRMFYQLRHGSHNLRYIWISCKYYALVWRDNGTVGRTHTLYFHCCLCIDNNSFRTCQQPFFTSINYDFSKVWAASYAPTMSNFIMSYAQL